MKHASFPLNSLEKFMLAHECEAISYNSHLVIEFRGSSSASRIREVALELVRGIPALRTTITEGRWGYRRHVRPFGSLSLDALVEESQAPLSDRDIDAFCNRPFALAQQVPLRFLVGRRPSGRACLVFSVHHSLCDGVGQATLLEQFGRLWNGEPLHEDAQSLKAYRFRRIVEVLGWIPSLKLVLRQALRRRKADVKGSPVIASLIDHPEALGRAVTARILDVDSSWNIRLKRAARSEGVSVSDYVVAASVRALDEVLQARGDLSSPLMVYVPKNLRPELRVPRRALQNLLTTLCIPARREDVQRPEFFKKVGERIRSYGIKQTANFLFGTLWKASVASPRRMRERILGEEWAATKKTSCSLFVSIGRMPGTLALPKDWHEVRVSGRGAMLRHPGLGVIFAGPAGSETLTLEWVRDLFHLQTIERFQEVLLRHLQGSSPLHEVNRIHNMAHLPLECASIVSNRLPLHSEEYSL